jgi:division protein CdvB (Snf7/Vps24/ESCRT-III family)
LRDGCKSQNPEEKQIREKMYQIANELGQACLNANQEQIAALSVQLEEQADQLTAYLSKFNATSKL